MSINNISSDDENIEESCGEIHSEKGICQRAHESQICKLTAINNRATNVGSVKESIVLTERSGASMKKHSSKVEEEQKVRREEAERDSQVNDPYISMSSRRGDPAH